MGPSDLAAAPRELLTARLSLEVPRAEHAPAFADSLGLSLHDPRFITWRRAHDLAWALHFCESDARSVAAGEDLVFHAFERAGRAYVGRIDLHTIDFDACRGEIGYAGDVRMAGRGLMREAALAVIDLAFGLGFERVEAMSDGRNERALRFALSLGMQREGLLRRHERDGLGEWCNMVLFARLRGD